jgi:hypothetical protein
VLVLVPVGGVVVTAAPLITRLKADEVSVADPDVASVPPWRVVKYCEELRPWLVVK